MPGALFTVPWIQLTRRSSCGFRDLRLQRAAFQATYVLQTRGCKPDMQKGALKCLDVLLGTSINQPLVIPLLPNNDACGWSSIISYEVLKLLV